MDVDESGSPTGDGRVGTSGMSTIMLSYSRRDEEAVKTLARGFEAARREVWFDHDLGGGDAWWDAILESIRTSTVFLFALSDAALHSKPCRLELDYALALGRPVLPVQVGPITSLRTNPLAELQIIEYDPLDARSGFAVLSAVDEAAARVRPLPDPLPAPPPIPFAYLLQIGRRIESTELSMADQVAALEQLRRALDEETDESVRRDILSMLRSMKDKPWTTRRSDREIAALLFAHGPQAPQDDEPAVADRAAADRAVADPAVAEPVADPDVPDPAPEPDAPGPSTEASEPDPREWFAQRMEQLYEQRLPQGGRPDRQPPASADTQWWASQPQAAAGPQTDADARSDAPQAGDPRTSGGWPGEPRAREPQAGSPPTSGPPPAGPPPAGPLPAGPQPAGRLPGGAQVGGPLPGGTQTAGPWFGGRQVSEPRTGEQEAGGLRAGEPQRDGWQAAGPWAAASGPWAGASQGGGPQTGASQGGRHWAGGPQAGGSQGGGPRAGEPSAAVPGSDQQARTDQPGAAGSPEVATPSAHPPRRHLVLSIIGIAGVFGLVALAYSGQVSRRLAAGDVPGAQRASNIALVWAIVGIVVGICLITLTGV
jgi:hypothetical protein